MEVAVTAASFVEHPITLSITKLVKLKSSIIYKFFNVW